MKWPDDGDDRSFVTWSKVDAGFLVYVSLRETPRDERLAALTVQFPGLTYEHGKLNLTPVANIAAAVQQSRQLCAAMHKLNFWVEWLDPRGADQRYGDAMAAYLGRP